MIKTPDKTRFTVQVIKLRGDVERFEMNSEKEMQITAASWFSRGAMVTTTDHKTGKVNVYASAANIK